MHLNYAPEILATIAATYKIPRQGRVINDLVDERVKRVESLCARFGKIEALGGSGRDARKSRLFQTAIFDGNNQKAPISPWRK